MRKVIYAIASILTLVLFNYLIVRNEAIKSSGEVVLLELAPVDPRSLMQGDYMQLRYTIEDDVRCSRDKKREELLVRLDSQNVAKNPTIYRKEKLAAGEKLINVTCTRYSIPQIQPRSFLFQEGHAKFYERAKYGIFKFDTSGNYLLVGLADAAKKTINPAGILN